MIQRGGVSIRSGIVRYYGALVKQETTAKDPRNMVIDPTSFLAPGAIVLGDVELGPDSSVWYYTVIRGDTERIRIGEGTNLQDFTMVHADPGIPCLIGRRVTVGHRVILHGCVVEDDCLIGMGAILLNRVKVGSGSVIGAGALLLEGTEIPPGSLVVGSPGKVIRLVDEAGRARIDRSWRNYVAKAARHRSGAFPVASTSLQGSAVEDVTGRGKLD
jgi:carbonic anhydrase/acetyltransferase-like protein (isoleucine patch superfamily)